MLLITVGISVPLVVIIQFSNQANNKLQVEFVSEEINTCADNIAWFLVKVSGSEAVIGKFNISIQTNVSIRTEHILWSSSTGNLLEILIYPNNSHVDSRIEVEVYVNTSKFNAKDSAIIDVLNWTPAELGPIEEKCNVFIQFLEDNYSELGINESISWMPICNDAGILVVGHFLFMSDYWEMEISWHVMIPPHDWVHCYIRYRGNVTPLWAGEISSWNNSDPIIEVVPPTQIYRPR
jgi:hypothetical protein